MYKTISDFDQRSEKTKYLEFIESHKKSARVWEIWRYYEWINIGNEISKGWLFVRPCVVVHTKVWNGLIMIFPLTTKYHDRMKRWYFEIHNYKRFWKLKKSWIILNQVQLIDRKRLSNKLSKKRIKKRVITYLLDKYHHTLKNTLTGSE